MKIHLKNGNHYYLKIALNYINTLLRNTIKHQMTIKTKFSW
jgi:hypothetical protein